MAHTVPHPHVLLLMCPALPWSRAEEAVVTGLISMENRGSWECWKEVKHPRMLDLIELGANPCTIAPLSFTHRMKIQRQR